MILNKCPKCGGELEYNNLCQYTEIYKILKSGRIAAKKQRKIDNGSMEASFISCSACNFVTDCDLHNVDFEVWEQNGQFHFERRER